jgi:bifunctional non-homologous end joining protein LigD
MNDVVLSSLDRVLWPRAGYTKGDLVSYYDAIAPLLLPHIADRALTLGRFPGGVDVRGFAQTECRGRPSWMPTHKIALRDGRTREYCVVNDRRSLAWVANQSTIELHPFLARVDHHDRPTHVIFDLDPGPRAGILDCARVALRLRAVLADLRLQSFAKTSGSVGIHVLVPLNVPHSYAQTKAFARGIARQLAAEDASVTDRVRRSDRADRVLVDWLANEMSRSAVAPYSLRAMDYPTVSTPVRWEELEGASGACDLWFLAPDVLARARADGDPLAPALTILQRLPS